MTVLRPRNCKSVFLLLLEEFEMYYGEKLIDGVLHWRGTPDGKWKQMSQERLTTLVLELRQRLGNANPSVTPYSPQPADLWRWWYEKNAPYIRPNDKYTWEPPFIVTCKDRAS